MERDWCCCCSPLPWRRHRSPPAFVVLGFDPSRLQTAGTPAEVSIHVAPRPRQLSLPGVLLLMQTVAGSSSAACGSSSWPLQLSEVAGQQPRRSPRLTQRSWCPAPPSVSVRSHNRVVAAALSVADDAAPCCGPVATGVAALARVADWAAAGERRGVCNTSCITGSFTYSSTRSHITKSCLQARVHLTRPGALREQKVKQQSAQA